MSTEPTWDQLWEQFYYHLRIRRRARSTLRFYRATQRALGRFAADDEGGTLASPAQVTVGGLRAFVVWLEQQGLAAGGVHAHVRSIKALFGWACREELLSRNPALRLERPTLPRRRLPTMNAERIGGLLKAARNSDQPLRDTAMLLTFFDTGIRLGELIGLRADDLQPDRGLLRVIGKGDQERSVPIGTRAFAAVNAYMMRERRPRPGVQHLFLNRRGQQMTYSAVSIRLARFSATLGFPREDTTPHTFRRGFAVEFLRNGGDVFTLQQILGHSSLEMTRRYVNFLDEDLKSAHLRFSPGDRL